MCLESAAKPFGRRQKPTIQTLGLAKYEGSYSVIIKQSCQCLRSFQDYQNVVRNKYDLSLRF